MELTEEQQAILEIPFNKDILKYCIEGKNSIQDVCNKVGLSYKTTLQRVKEMEKHGFIKLKQDGNKTIVSLTSYPNFQINSFIGYENELNKLLLNKTNLNVLIQMLEFYKNNRLASYQQLISHLKNKGVIFNNISPIHYCMEEVGLIRHREEITKKGIKFLNDHKNDK